jgi:hypothetical protein
MPHPPALEDRRGRCVSPIRDGTGMAFAGTLGLATVTASCQLCRNEVGMLLEKAAIQGINPLGKILVAPLYGW